jgi:hypothetical protein
MWRATVSCWSPVSESSYDSQPVNHPPAPAAVSWLAPSNRRKLRRLGTKTVPSSLVLAISCSQTSDKPLEHSRETCCCSLRRDHNAPRHNTKGWNHDV